MCRHCIFASVQAAAMLPFLLKDVPIGLSSFMSHVAWDRQRCARASFRFGRGFVELKRLAGGVVFNGWFCFWASCFSSGATLVMKHLFLKFTSRQSRHSLLFTV